MFFFCCYSVVFIFLILIIIFSEKIISLAMVLGTEAEKNQGIFFVWFGLGFFVTVKMNSMCDFIRA